MLVATAVAKAIVRLSDADRKKLGTDPLHALVVVDVIRTAITGGSNGIKLYRWSYQSY